MADEEKAADLRWDWIESRVRNAFKHVKDDSEFEYAPALTCLSYFEPSAHQYQVQNLKRRGLRLSKSRLQPHTSFLWQSVAPISASHLDQAPPGLLRSEFIHDFLANADTRLLVVSLPFLARLLFDSQLCGGPVGRFHF